MPGGHEEVKTGKGGGCTGRMRMGQGVAREDRVGEIQMECSSLISLLSPCSDRNKTKNPK